LRLKKFLCDKSCRCGMPRPAAAQPN